MGLNVGTLTAFLSLNNSSFLQGLAQSNRAMETLRVATVAATTATTATTAAQVTAGAAAARLTAAQASQATATSLAANAQRELSVLLATGTATSGALSQAQARLAAANASLATADARLAAAQAASTSASAGLTAAQTAQAAAAANVTAAQAGVAAANTRTTASTQQTATATATLTATLGKLAVALVGVNVGMKALTFAKDSVVGFNSTLEQTRIAFTTMLGSAQKADAFIAEMKAFARTTPFEFSGLVTASQRLIAMGIAAKDIKPYLTAIGDAVAGLGGGRAEVDRFVLALGQMSAAGKVNAQDLRQMTELGVPATRILAEAYGLTVAQMRKMVETGNVMSADAIPRLIAGIENGTSATAAFGGMMAKQSQTWRGALSNIGDSLQMALADIGLPLFQQMSKGAQGLAADLASPGFKQFSRTMSDSVAYGIGLAVDVTGDFLSVLGQVTSALGALEPLAVGAGAAFVGIGEAVRFVTGLMGAHATEVAAVAVAVGGAVLAYKGMQAAELAIIAVRIAWQTMTTAAANGAIQSAIASAIGSFNLMKLASVGVGLALAAGLIWWQRHKQAVQEAEQRIAQYTDTLRQDNGVIGENTRAKMRNVAADEGLYEAGRRIGVQAGTLNAAMGGNKVAMDQVTTAIAATQAEFEKYGRHEGGKKLQDDAAASIKLRDALNGANGEIKTAQQRLADTTAGLDDNTDATTDNTDAVDDNRNAQELVANALGTTSDELKNQTRLSDILKSALDILSGSALSVEDAQSSFLGSLRDIGKTVDDNVDKLDKNAGALDDVSTSLDINTETGSKNRQNIRDAIKAANDWAQAQTDAGVATDIVTGQYGANIAAIKLAGEKAGLTQKDIEEMIAAMSVDVPTMNLTIMAANLNTTVDQLHEIQRVMGALDGRSITTYTESVSKFTTQDQANEFLASPYATPARASGGPVRAGMLYKANELGHEYFQPAMDGRILSASETKAALSAKGNGSSADVVAALDRQTQALTAQSAALAQYQAQAYVDAADRSRLAAAAGSSSVNR